MSLKSTGEKIQWLLTLANTAHDFKESFKPKTETTPGKTEPSEKPQRMPGAFGLSLEGERLFNGVLCQLDVKDQLLITNFLSKKCKSFQRERFIEVVSGLEVTQGVPGKKERTWDKKTGKSSEVAVPAIPGKDRRQEFLEKFAKILRDPATADKAFDYAVGARTILKHSLYNMFKEEAHEIKRERKAKAKKGAYKGFWKTAISLRRRK